MVETRATRQKQMIQQAIESTKDWFSADDIHQAVGNTIGLATVYRYLSTLRSQEKLHAYTCGGKTVYSRQKKTHCHFTCTHCGDSSHFDLDKVDFLKEKIKGDICHFQLDVSGTCAACKNS